jgi:hypothetical protein
MAFPNLLNMFKGKAGGSQMKPLQDLQKEELDNWGGYDSGNEKSKMTQYANAYNGQSDEQNTAMFGQGGDVKKQMGTIWDQIKSGAGKFKEGVQNLDEKMESNYAKSGWGGKDYKNPYAEPVEPKEELTYSSTGENIDNSNVPITEGVDKVLADQQTPEGQEFKANMNKYKEEGDFASGQGMGQAYGGSMGGMLGGWLSRAMGKTNPWDFEVQSKHRYQKPR